MSQACPCASSALLVSIRTAQNGKLYASNVKREFRGGTGHTRLPCMPSRTICEYGWPHELLACPSGKFAHAQHAAQCTNAVQAISLRVLAPWQKLRARLESFPPRQGTVSVAAQLARARSVQADRAHDSCAAGQSQHVGTPSCSKCRAGYFGANSGSSVCVCCPEGKYSDSEGATSCDGAPSGSFASQCAVSATIARLIHFSRKCELVRAVPAEIL